MKVMTLNINYYSERYGPWSIRRQLIRDVLDKANPDIVALQAVRRDPAVEDGADQAAQLATLFSGYKFIAYQPAHAFPNGVTQGSAILSQLPIAAKEILPLTLLPDQEDTNRRIVQAARFDLPSGPFYLFNAHFSWVAEQVEQNIEETLAFLEVADGPALLVGDLNTPPDSPLLDRFRRAGWTDLWAQLNPGDEGYTFVEGEQLAKRIDYAWANPQLCDKVLAIECVADQTGQNECTALRPRRVADHAQPGGGRMVRVRGISR
jgi:endonuclease/exonuclease/phosphatase family metal-dependent hydrolase